LIVDVVVVVACPCRAISECDLEETEQERVSALHPTNSVQMEPIRLTEVGTTTLRKSVELCAKVNGLTFER
jgi:hypothetical protein